MRGKCAAAGLGGLLFLACGPSATASTLTVLHAFTDRDGSNPLAGLVESQGSFYGTTQAGGAHGHGTVFRISAQGKLKKIYSFTGKRDGNQPIGGLVADLSGNLYGTTVDGGKTQNGVVYKIAADGTQSVVHAFKGGADGRAPFCTLVIDANGNLFGTTAAGGTYDKGTIFKIAPDGTESVLYSFGHTGKDGRDPFAGLTIDADGNLYGTTVYGGQLDQGTVYEFTADGQEKVLYAFSVTNNDGIYPYASLIRDEAGNLYGTAESGGGSGAGAVFKVSPNGRETVLHHFTGGTDGCTPSAPLVADSAGNMYGTTYECGEGTSFGTVFKITPNGKLTTLYSFTDVDKGLYPSAGLLLDANGNLYGTTYQGGTVYGTVFRLKP